MTSLFSTLWPLRLSYLFQRRRHLTANASPEELSELAKALALSGELRQPIEITGLPT